MEEFIYLFERCTTCCNQWSYFEPASERSVASESGKGHEYSAEFPGALRYCDTGAPCPSHLYTSEVFDLKPTSPTPNHPAKLGFVSGVRWVRFPILHVFFPENQVRSR